MHSMVFASARGDRTCNSRHKMVVEAASNNPQCCWPVTQACRSTITQANTISHTASPPHTEGGGFHLELRAEGLCCMFHGRCMHVCMAYRGCMHAWRMAGACMRNECMLQSANAWPIVKVIHQHAKTQAGMILWRVTALQHLGCILDMASLAGCFHQLAMLACLLDTHKGGQARSKCASHELLDGAAGAATNCAEGNYVSALAAGPYMTAACMAPARSMRS